LLENDVELLKAAYKGVIHPDEQMTLARTLLGDPKLDVGPGVGGAKQKVVVRIGNVARLGYEELDTPQGRAVRELIAEYYVRFDEYDQMSFPLYYDTGKRILYSVEPLPPSPLMTRC
jgi:hypothetical protein